MMKKIVTLGMVLVVCMGVFAGCVDDEGIDEFEWTRTMSVRFRVQSDESKFDIDNVTLDFSYAGNCGYEESFMGVYFNTEYLYGVVHFSDYKNINGYSFIKEISFEEFNTEEYDYWGLFGNNFYHTETLTVPTEIFTKEEGTFSFSVNEISFAEDENKYYFIESSQIDFNYKKLDNNTIHIFFGE